MISTVLKTLSLALTRLLVGARAGGRLPVPGVQRVYCANHASHLDAVLLMASLEDASRARPLAAADYWRGRVRRFWAERVFRTVLVDRRQAALNPLVAAFAALRQGDSLIVFPEGTRGQGGALQALKPGVFHLARVFSHVEFVPVWIEGAHRILPKGAFVPVPSPCAVTFGTPLRWDGREDAPAFLARLRDGMEASRAMTERPAMARLSALLQE